MKEIPAPKCSGKRLTTKLRPRALLDMVFCLCCWLVVPQDGQADTDALRACSASDKAVVSIGLPNRHRDLASAMLAVADAARGVIAPNKVCASFTYGNDYQLLDWLETGKIDAAVVSPFVAQIFRNRGEKPLSASLGMATTWPFSGEQLPAYRVGLQVMGNAAPEPNPASAYDRFIESIRATGVSKDSQIIVDSFLSANLPLLLDYTEFRLNELAPSSTDSDNGFWSRFLRPLTLRDGESTIPPSAGEPLILVRSFPVSDAIPNSDTILFLGGKTQLRDVFVYSKDLHSRLFADTRNEYDTDIDWRAKSVSAWLNNEALQGVSGGSSLVKVLDHIYASRAAGFRKHRDFRFKLDEVWRFLDDGEINEEPFALILTGGGVKAAYQTALIDHLYGEGYLTNSRGADATQSQGLREPIRVDHVIGTSGGALLGTFVMAIDEGAAPQLAQTLWRNKEGKRYIDNFDVFPFIEMPRYMTVIAGGLLFSFVLLILKRCRPLCQWSTPTTFPRSFETCDKVNSWLSPRAIWFFLLALSPWVIKLVNGVKGLEHVPATAGVFYSACVLVFAWSDNRLIFNRSFSWAHVKFPGKYQKPLLGLGVLLVVAPFVGLPSPEWLETEHALEFGLGQVTRATLLCCIGFLMVFLVVHSAFRTSGKGGEDTQKVGGWTIVFAFAVLFLVPVVATAMVWLTEKSLFELSVEFWLNFAVWCLLVSVLLIGIGHFPGIAAKINPFKIGLDFLVSGFPKPDLNWNRKHYMRATRVSVLGALALIYWNLVMAPAIYGNEEAKNHFERTYREVFCKSEMTKRECDLYLEDSLAIQPTINFVVSATSLEMKSERYFVFNPYKLGRDRDPASGVSAADERLDERLDELLQRDPRWIAAEIDVTPKALLNIVFASGSPFPIFPATRAGLSIDVEEHEWLVDGGFAHNVPIEAANALGARRVLVISSSPLHRHETVEGAESGKIEFEAMLRWGNLIQNVPRLFPYLFERSQVEDALSAQDMLVVTISPVLRGDWPWLTDFKSEVVERLLGWAQEDENARIAIVESWGPPMCEFQGIRYDCQQLKRIEIPREADSPMSEEGGLR